MANPAIALVGSESLLGREIRDIATTTADLDLKLIASDENEGSFTRLGDEATVVSGLNAASLSDARAVILAGSPESSEKALRLLGDPPEAAIIDLTYAAEERPEARLRAPAVESDDATDDPDEAAIHVIAHPAAIALAIFLRRLHRNDPVRRAVVQILAPASEHGTPGIEELQKQTVSLLSFQSMPRDIFDSQLSFNLLARYGSAAPVTLEQSELRIERHLASLLSRDGQGEGAPMPSLRLIQAPVFHGYSFSAWVEFEDVPEMEALEASLSMDAIDVRGEDLDPPTNVGQAGQGGISVGAILPDRSDASAVWFWFVADNLRLQAENAVAIAQRLV